MKKWLLLIAFVAAVFLVPTTSHAKFPDVNYNTEMGRAIDFLEKEGVIKGFPNGTFQPYRLVTRGQAAKMMSEITYSKPMFYVVPAVAESRFKDVSQQHEYFESIHALYEYNVVSGYPDGTFRMQQNINRAQVSKMITNAFVLPEVSTTAAFTDIAKGTDRYYYANRAYAAGIMPYTTFSPNKTVSRGEMALFLFRAYNKTAVDVKQAQTLQPFIGTNTTLGLAWKNHSFMKKAVRQQMPIAAMRQTTKQPHYYAGYEMPYPCSFYASNDGDFNICYENGIEGHNGIVTVYLYDYDMKQRVQFSKLKEALGANAFTIETFTQENGELMHRGYTKNAVNGLYYGFSAYGGSAASPFSLDASIITQMNVSVYPTVTFY